MADDLDFVIWGSSGHAKVLLGTISRLSGRVLATFDNDPDAQSLGGIPLYVGENGFFKWLAGVSSPQSVVALVAIGGDRGRDRVHLHDFMRERGLLSVPLIDPAAIVDLSAVVGGGVQILPGAIVAAEASIGRASIINHRASIDHECCLGVGVHVAPGATLCGLVTVGDAAIIGAGAVILPRLKIGAGARVGAGAVVTKDVPPGLTVMGCPARLQDATREFV
jgi:sugar O-acyltransferase (sialic acid O-acetyltransferase NeuD family)